VRLENRIAVVTGSGAGIGRAIAQELSKEGARVVVADINFSAAQETARQIQSAGGAARAVLTDVADAASVQSLVEEALKAFSQVHVLVNNAAIMVNKTLEDTTVEEWNRQIAVNLGGIFLSSKFFLPHLRKTKGNIVNMASDNGFFVETQCAGYCATKGAIIAVTKAMAIDHGKEGIRVNCICPGYINTGMAQAYFDVQPDPVAARQSAGMLHALWRVGRAEEVAKVAAFLASDDASFMTGSTVVVDGGFASGLPPKP